MIPWMWLGIKTVKTRQAEEDGELHHKERHAGRSRSKQRNAEDLEENTRTAMDYVTWNQRSDTKLE